MNSAAAGTMPDIAVAVENVSKRYLIGHRSARREAYTTLREAIGREARDFARKTVDVVRGRQIVQGDEVEEFWALKDVSFEVGQGDVLGIIGQNGAGKSTLLKILSQITEPERGRVILRGRVASLLEIGTGFHPELTGHENIYLNGAILGMKRAEIKRKFDEIVAFADVERFLDTPVKRYSSGMYLRLAFAVAAHLEPEILVVDEVLAVGDANFQKKCLSKMSEVAKGGRTVLFVSHNLQAITSLCTQGLLVDEGRIVASGQPSTVVDHYMREVSTSLSAARDQIWGDPTTAPGNDRIRLHRIRLIADINDPLKEIDQDTPICVEVEYWNLIAETKMHVELAIHSIDGSDVLEDWSAEEANWSGRRLPAGLFKTVCQIPGSLLNEGSYRIRIQFVDSESVRILYTHDDAAFFCVSGIGERAVAWHGRFIGFVHPRLGWSTDMIRAMAPSALAYNAKESDNNAVASLISP
jgi:lipopolysaccharide transport system ATP-binding protein